MGGSDRRPIIVAAAVGVALLAGCTGGNDRVETVLRRQRAALDRGGGAGMLPPPPRPADDPAAGRGAAPPLPTGELSLPLAREITLWANPDISAAQARLEQALARVREAQAAFYPVISLGATNSRTFLVPALQSFSLPTTATPFSQLVPLLTAPEALTVGSVLGILTTPFLQQPSSFSGVDQSAFSQHSVSTTVVWTLFDGFLRDARVLAFKYNQRAADYLKTDVQRLLVNAVDAAYHQAQLGVEQVRVAEADVDFSREQLTEIQKKLAVGTATRGDVNIFELRVLSAQTTRVVALGVRDTGRVLLAELMGLPAAQLPPELGLAPLGLETEAEMSEPEDEAWIASAVQNRPDLLAAEQTYASATENTRVAKAQFSPTLNLSGTYGFDRRSNLKFSEVDQASGIALEMRWQLFTGGFRTAQLRRAAAERAEAAALWQRTHNAIVSEVRQAIISLRNAQEEIRLQRKALEVAEENRRIVRAQYAAGTAGWVTLNEVQRNYVESDARLASARLRMRQAWSNLYRAVGSFP